LFIVVGRKDEDTTGVIGSRNSKKKKKNNNNNQYIAKRKLTNNIVQNTVQKTKDRATRTPHETEGKIRYSGRVICSCSTCGIRRVTLGTHPVMNLE